LQPHTAVGHADQRLAARRIRSDWRRLRGLCALALQQLLIFLIGQDALFMQALEQIGVVPAMAGAAVAASSSAPAALIRRNVPFISSSRS